MITKFVETPSRSSDGTDSATADPSTDDTKKNKGLSSGEIANIVVGCVLGFILSVFFVFVVMS